MPTLPPGAPSPALETVGRRARNAPHSIETIFDVFCLGYVREEPKTACEKPPKNAIFLPVKKKQTSKSTKTKSLEAPPAAADEISTAKQILKASVPEAAHKLLSIMSFGDKDDSIQLTAATQVLAMNGISAKHEAAADTAKIAGAAVLSAILGMGRVMNLENKALDALRKRFPKESALDVDLLPPELLEQDALT
jgi:hypothetical protein